MPSSGASMLGTPARRHLKDSASSSADNAAGSNSSASASAAAAQQSSSLSGPAGVPHAVSSSGTGSSGTRLGRSSSNSSLGGGSGALVEDEDDPLLNEGSYSRSWWCLRIFRTPPLVERTVLYNIGGGGSGGAGGGGLSGLGGLGGGGSHAVLASSSLSSSLLSQSSALTGGDGGGLASDSSDAPASAAALAACPARVSVEPALRYPPNTVCNQKYSVLTFLPLFLFNEFRFFFNLYFLVVALTQFFPVLQVGFLFTYVAPLAMVLVVSMVKEIYDDFQRFLRDHAANGELFERVSPTGIVEPVAAKDIKVGDIVVLHTNQRVPADCVLLRTHDAAGSVFIRTDQLDGETDWKLRRAVPTTQALPDEAALVRMRARLVAEAPRLEIYGFAGVLTFFGMQPGYEPPRSLTTANNSNAVGQGKGKGQKLKVKRSAGLLAFAPAGADAHAHGSKTKRSGSKGQGARLTNTDDDDNDSDSDDSDDDEEEDGGDVEAPKATAAAATASATASASAAVQSSMGATEPLSLENTLWANTVVASGTIAAAVIYTGRETRSALNASQPVTKSGLLDDEVNQLSKVLFGITMLLALAMTTLRGFEGQWYIYLFRFVLLFSSIIPISLRVNLDMGKALYSLLMMRDAEIPETVVRSSTIPEELGRVSYVFTDKTGTLTQNVMLFKTVQLAPQLTYGREQHDILKRMLSGAYAKPGTSVQALEEAEAAAAAAAEAGITATPHSLTIATGGGASGGNAGLKTSASGSGSGGGGSGGGGGGGSAGTWFADPESDNDTDSFSVTIAGTDTGSNAHTSVGYDYDPFSSGARVRSASNSNSNNNSSGALGGFQTESSSLSLSSNANAAHGAGAAAAGGLLQSESATELALTRSQSALDAARRTTRRAHEFAATVEGAGMSLGEAHALTRAAFEAVALCHNVTPVTEEGSAGKTFQAASPDEVALVSYADSAGLGLEARDVQTITLRAPTGELETFDIIVDFPFTSESKRMGIIVRSRTTRAVTFYLKGAESAIIPRIEPSEWLEEEVANLARVGLRTLVYAKRSLTEAELAAFMSRLAVAKASMANREAQVLAVLDSIERGLTLLALTGVEDKLQEHVRPSLEMLRNAGVKIWMLTGDKAETAACIGISARLIDRGQSIVRVLQATSRVDALRQLGQTMSQPNACIVVDGGSLQLLLDHFPWDFLDAASQAPAVICCRCSPTQKADVVTRMKAYTGKRVLAIGDGGNDVSMVQAADVGVGIVGKEGMQAAMAADFSITQFSFLVRLMLWHGRNSYKRSATLSQFVMHRGLIIAIIQAVFSSLFFYVAVSIYTGWIMVGYTTIFTMFPVFSLVLDEDVDPTTAFMFPELYRELQKGRPLSYKTFFVWCFLSVYQGGLIMILGILLFEDSFVNIVSITFTALILAELANVALSIHKWNPYMVGAQVLSIIFYFVSMVVLRSYFDITFIFTLLFMWKVCVITAVVTLPPALLKWAIDRYDPPAYSKVSLAGRG